MTEIISNKINPNVLPHLQIWEWQVPIYLFLGGLSGGLLIITSAMILLQKDGIFSRAPRTGAYDRTIQIGSLLSPIFLTLGMFSLFLMLDYKIHVWRFFTNIVFTSPTSWGGWILTIFFPFSVFQALVVNETYFGKYKQLKPWIEFFKPYLNKIAFINVHIGAGIGVYTGIMLSTFFARPLWSSSVLGFIFLLSGLSAAAAVLLLMASSDKRPLFVKMDLYFISLEGFAMTLFILGGLSGTENLRNAMIAFLTGPYAPWFWILFVLGGLILPLFLETLESLKKIRFSPLVPVLVLVGSLSLRFIIVYAGQAMPTFS